MPIVTLAQFAASCPDRLSEVWSAPVVLPEPYYCLMCWRVFPATDMVLEGAEDLDALPVVTCPVCCSCLCYWWWGPLARIVERWSDVPVMYGLYPLPADPCRIDTCLPAGGWALDQAETES